MVVLCMRNASDHVNSSVVVVLIEQIPRSTERISRFLKYFLYFYFILFFINY